MLSAASIETILNKLLRSKEILIEKFNLVDRLRNSNSASLHSKARITSVNFVGVDFSYLAFTETWLKANLHSSELSPNMFHNFRRSGLYRTTNDVLNVTVVVFSSCIKYSFQLLGVSIYIFLFATSLELH